MRVIVEGEFFGVEFSKEEPKAHPIVSLGEHDGETFVTFARFGAPENLPYPEYHVVSMASRFYCGIWGNTTTPAKVVVALAQSEVDTLGHIGDFHCDDEFNGTPPYDPEALARIREKIEPYRTPSDVVQQRLNAGEPPVEAQR